jgi:hypothetical protein
MALVGLLLLLLPAVECQVRQMALVDLFSIAVASC